MIRLVAVLICGLASTQCTAHASPPPAQPAAMRNIQVPPSAQAWSALNTHARAIYAKARTEMLEAADPVLLVYPGDKLVLLHAGKRQTFEGTPPQVDGLKIVAHTALAAWTLLERSTHDPDAWRPLAEAFADGMRKCQTHLADYGFAPDDAERQQHIMNAVQDALRLPAKPTQAEVRGFAATMLPLVMANVDTATGLLLETLNNHVHQVKAQLGAQAFAALRVIVVGGHMPREREFSGQYFQKLFGGETEGQRWIYAENVANEAQALGALGVHIIDNHLSTDFFGNATRMHRDLLSDAAQDQLAHMTLPTL